MFKKEEGELRERGSCLQALVVHTLSGAGRHVLTTSAALMERAGDEEEKRPRLQARAGPLLLPGLAAWLRVPAGRRPRRPSSLARSQGHGNGTVSPAAGASSRAVLTSGGQTRQAGSPALRCAADRSARGERGSGGGRRPSSCGKGT